jgi:hypothetical protein
VWNSSTRLAVVWAHRVENLLQAALAVVFDDDAGARGQVGFDVGFRAAGIGSHDVDAAVVQPPCGGLALDDELHVEAGQQDLVEHPDDQLVLADS